MIELASTVIYVQDVVQAMRFYQEAFGFDIKFLDTDVQFPGRIPGERYQFGELNVPGGALQFGTPALGALAIPGFPPRAESSSVELAFYTSDVERSYERAIAAGAEPLRAPEVMPWGQTVSYVRSPHGVYLCICARPVQVT